MMNDRDDLKKKLEDFVPPIFKEVMNQSQEASEKLIEVFANKSGLVLRADFEKLQKFVQDLEQRCTALENKLKEESRT